MPARDDPAPDPFDFREPPAPVEADRPADPAGPARSPFACGDEAGRGGRRRPLRDRRAELRAAGLSSPGAVAVGLAVLVVVALLVAAVVALL